VRLACVVEGHGDVEAIPVLLRRIAFEHLGVHVDVPRPFRAKRQKIVRQGELERTVQLEAAKVGGDGAILVLLDADDDCPAQLAPDLLARARACSPGSRIAVVLANREFEAWFLAAAASLRQVRALTFDGDPPAAPERLRDAKGWLNERMPRGYSETVDQPAFAAQISLDEAMACPSFAKLVRDVTALLT
jgi:hypothetical protein